MKLRLFVIFVVVCSLLSAIPNREGRDEAQPVISIGNEPVFYVCGNSLQLVMPQTADVKVAVFDIRGRYVASLFKGKLVAGTHEIRWTGCDDNGNPVPPGSYLIKVQGDGIWHGHKVILLK